MIPEAPETMPRQHWNKPAKPFRDRRHVKLLFILAGIELLLILGLLIWAIGSRPAKAPDLPTTAQTQTTKPLKPMHVALTLYAAGLKEPVTIAAFPDVKDKRLFVVQQNGIIKVVTGNMAVSDTPLLDISAKVQDSGEMGLLGMAFHPKAKTNHYFFVDYVDLQRNTIISRYTFNPSTGVADPTSEKVLLKIPQPYPNHKGGNIVFGPDGYLYIGMGDGGSAGDPENRAQNKNELLGKLLRIDVDKGDPYAIPTGNPFATTAGVRPEIWALGLRNPWRFSFDKKTGDLFIADVGQNTQEEVDFQKAGSGGGLNYGWRCYEGTLTYDVSSGCLAANNYIRPILTYDHSGRCSITGGYIYRGSKEPAMSGTYFYADYCGGQLYGATKSKDGTWKAELALKDTYTISTFGQDNGGELYAADRTGGGIYHLEDTAN